MRQLLTVLTLGLGVSMLGCGEDEEGKEGEAEAESEAEGEAEAESESEGEGDPELSCLTYCTCMEDTCDDSFASMEECMTECKTLDEGVYAGTGDNLGCRQYHCDNAAMSTTAKAVTLHCGHADGTTKICVPAK